MNYEILRLETSEKLAKREKAIKYCNNVLKREVPAQVKMYVQNILNILEVKDD